MPNPDRVPPPIRQLLSWDVRFSKYVVDTTYSHFPQLNDRNFHSLMKVLEWSCHGIIWLALAFISIYLSIASRVTSVNLLLLLFYDIVIIAVTKAVTRRSRPSADPNAISVDKFSFPSGHATRSVLLTCFFSFVTGSAFLTAISGVWAAAICASRVLLRRHHVVDVLAGIGIGFVEWMLVSVLWAEEDTAAWVASFIAGAEDEYN